MIFMKTTGYLIVFLIAVNIILSAYIGFASNSENYICDTGVGCDVVANSEYSSIFGMKVAWFGAICFIALLISYFFLKHDRYHIFFAFTAVGLIFSIYFIYLQFFVIKALCSNCLVIDFLAISLFIVSSYEIHQLINTKKSKK